MSPRRIVPIKAAIGGSFYRPGQKGLGHIRVEPVTHGNQAGKTAGPNFRPHLGDDVANTVRLQLLWKWSLLLNILTLSVAKRLIHIGSAARKNHRGPFQFRPGELWIGFATGEQKAIHFIDLGEMGIGRLDAF